MQERKSKIFLPLLKSGKINIYGFYHREVSGNNGSPFTTSSTLTTTPVFYYQNANENYAIDYFNIELQDIFKTQDRLSNPLKELFKDCPELVKKANDSRNYKKNLSKEDRKKLKAKAKKSYKDNKKAYGEIPKEERRGDLVEFHQYNLKAFEDLFSEYENCK